MIFSVPGHIEMIRNGLHHVVLRQHDPKLIIKTQTRRLNRGIYRVGRDYAVQRKRGVKAELDIRIVIDRIWEEQPQMYFIVSDGTLRKMEFSISREESTEGIQRWIECHCISTQDAWAEGGYISAQFERTFKILNLDWDEQRRYAFEFHVIKAQK